MSRDTAHLFFEGPSDARIFSHLMGFPATVDFRSAHEIDDDSGVESHPLWGGHKLRLISLALEAESHGDIDNIRCLVDDDFGIFVKLARRCRTLFETEFANLPATTLTFEWLKGFLIKGYGLVLSEESWDEFVQALSFAFLVRFTSATSETPWTAVDVGSFVDHRKGKLSFDALAYLRKSTQDNAAIAKKRTQEINALIEWLSNEFDHRRLVNSNDIFSFIHAFLRKSGKITGSESRDSIRQSYLAALDDDIIKLDGFKCVTLWLDGFIT